MLFDSAFGMVKYFIVKRLFVPPQSFIIVKTIP